MKKKIIPCLDMKDGKVVKGIHFDTLKTIGDPLELALKYQQQGADELVFLDISATLENRKTTLDVIKKISSQITIPFTVGGGIASIEDMERIFDCGASKVSIGTAAFKNPDLIRQASEKFGSDKIVIAIDVKKNDTGWNVVIKGGKENTNVAVTDWAKQCQQSGAGELLVTSMDTDGVTQGYDIDLYQELKKTITLPLVASGGCGSVKDIYDVFDKTDIEAALAASLFHYDVMSVQEVKTYLREQGVCI